MRRTIHTLMAAALLMTATVLAAPPPPPDYFPLHVGDWWKYQSTGASGQKSEFTIKVTGEDKNHVFTVETTNPAVTIDEFYTKPAGRVDWHKELYVKNNMTAEFQPVRQFLENPLKSGATWGWTGNGMMNTAIDEKNKVVGEETVVVPAGKFAAMHVHSDVTQGGTQVKKDYWYANHIGLVKSMTDSSGMKSTTELTDYSFRKH